MQNLRNLIPSPGALFVFEAAGRLSSFTRAAEELSISQAAVSYAIKQLEEALGQALFRRQHRKVALTEAGERFFSDVSIGLAHIRRSAEALHQSQSGRHVTLSVSTAFASQWILPRLAGFHADCPSVDLRLQTTDRDSDLAAEGIALGIRRGSGGWAEYETALLAPEEIRPICSPAYLANELGVPTVESLAREKLIHLEEPFRVRPGWSEWFSAHGVTYQSRDDGLRLNDYALVIQAAQEGEGVALGWQHLTRRLIEQGVLVNPVDEVLHGEFGFYVVWPKTIALSPDAEQVRDWLLTQAEV
ncbi:LysR substrate-binding domain-containing protein [Pelagibius sp. Alg239-R121]|uniref:LysR substrate-binding domain-containing protein n=1 Tax=Pelagibius sp. Alg239-R121 TaxID=2993448 RepID=UPI0024A67BDA|nr:LysR substrate-binding domain-containing protein [Pelagibius sp. Alg239-R121]